MKKIIFAIAAVALMSSCSKQEITNVGSEENVAIGFNTYLNRITRAVDADLVTLKDGFKVYGYYRTGTAAVFSPNYFNGSVVSYVDSAWTYNDTKYWPTEGYVDFVALANNTGTFVADATDGALVTYSGSSNPATQKDLLVATAPNTSKADNALSGVSLQFKHILSRIDVKVKNTTGDASLKLVVKSIKFTSIKPNGSFKVSNSAWTASGTAATNAIGLIGGQIEQTGDATAYADANSAAGALMIVPQAKTSIEVEYEYYQKTTDGLSYIRVANFTGANKKTITLSENWNSDTKYTYELAFGNLSDMTAITFSASVSEWTNSSTTNL